MEDGDYDTNTAALSMNSNNDNDGANINDGERAGRTRSMSTSTSNSNHRRSMSGSLLSKLSFLRTTNQATATSPEHTDNQSAAMDGRGYDDGDGSNDVSSGGASNLRGGKAIASALQQQRRTRRRRGSLRKTALLGTRLESKKTNKGAGGNNNMMDIWRGEDAAKGMSTRPFTNSVSSTGGTEPMSQSQGSFDRGGRENNPRWGYVSAQQRRVSRGSFSRHEPNVARNKLLGDETVTDDEDVVTFTHRNNVENKENENPKIIAAGLQHNPLTSPSSSSDSYYALQPDSAYGAVHRTKSPLATHHHPADHQEIIWDYSETEWWGWIILIVTWLVFVVGMGSCFGVWSWAWDVGETPYAPPELEDDPTLPIVGYYPALIILTAVMSWVWVVVAWVGMKYFKHANISGEDI